ncbi:two-component sensor histidine kinase [Shewanella sp. JM162201]|uniref:histidine kinase n=1 Tax=Shewanella jiangmenensis TaxID=2837387 RepID=A0ABS5V1E2_9GAMM|nr:ATP-binding protein [Shewanella jiangmenensis]MBT1444288.1 two-component sensor histidine kinase [Shewanella jiangmenensis]
MKPQLLRLFVLIIASCALIVWSFNLIYSAFDDAYGYNLDAEALLRQGSLEFRDIPAGHIAFSAELMEKLAAGQLISLGRENGESYYYQQLENGDLREMGPVVSRPGSDKITALIPLLYASLALTILLLIGRVFKDLSLLQSKALSFGDSPQKLKTGIRPRSAIYPLALSFETMTAQIMDFLQLHKDLSRTISHEIRTPLSRMRFALELSREQLPEQYLSRLSQDIDQIEELTRSYLSFAQVEHQQHKQTRQWLDADAFMADLLSKFSIYADRFQFSLQLDCQASGGKIQIDPLSMELAAQNLIANALRYAGKQIRISLLATERHWTLTVADDGPGFDDKGSELRRAFERGQKEQSSGYGLGLYIVRKIAIWHQGTVKIKRDSDLGGAAISLRWRRPVF